MAQKNRREQPKPTSSSKGRTSLPPHKTAQSARYTAPAPKFRIRPRWHRLAGWLGVLAGVAIAVANDAMLMSVNWKLLPGGHREFYLVLAVIVAGSSTWFLGAFDRGTTVYD